MGHSLELHRKEHWQLQCAMSAGLTAVGRTVVVAAGVAVAVVAAAVAVPFSSQQHGRERGNSSNRRGSSSRLEQV